MDRRVSYRIPRDGREAEGILEGFGSFPEEFRQGSHTGDYAWVTISVTKAIVRKDDGTLIPLDIDEIRILND